MVSQVATHSARNSPIPIKELEFKKNKIRSKRFRDEKGMNIQRWIGFASCKEFKKKKIRSKRFRDVLFVWNLLKLYTI